MATTIMQEPSAELREGGSGFQERGILRGLQRFPNGDAGDSKTAAEIGLHQNADGEADFFLYLGVCKYSQTPFGKVARAGANSSFPAEGDGASAGADRALFDRTIRGFAQRAGNILGFYVKTANIIEPAVVGFSDESVGARDIFVAGFSDSPMSDCGGSIKDTERVGQDNGSFDLTEFVDLRGADEFAESIVDEDGAGDFVLKEIAGVGEDGGNARADVVAF